MSVSSRSDTSIELRTLRTPLQDTPIDRTLQFNLLKALLGLNVSETELKRIDLSPFFKFYAERCDFALTDRGHYVSCKTHEDLISIAKCIRHGHTREEIQARLRLEYANPSDQEQDHGRRFVQVQDDAINGSIDLAAGLLTMIGIGKPRFGSLGYEVMEWRTGPFGEFIRNWFDEQKTQTGEYVRFERSFHALSLEVIAGVKIEWTYNLVDHLRLLDADDDQHESVVQIFHCASFLHLQKYRTHPLLPPSLIDETLQTIALLLPREDESVQTWYRKIEKQHTLDPSAIKLPYLKREQRRIENFSFWRERLIILKQCYDESEPRDIRQWWYDRRKGVQWYTFWVAIFVLLLTLFFGLVQSIEGALQVYKSYHPTL
ncbi:hypothetical protein P170DRAFT_507003 [Aspergillus steynii IBT 23096]|uniref:Uncharacterized protein n=1 Tax=Aspergillus steynii IBT 23096 TaxID=1392250 RepID=A0A2I2GH16_9EURO|nr:uncharacterized protein P170DRAFT_507003 [Aspergillus steynii IBT 23096]PLB52137.1 hypothetical protein P170DRAFT_507003 [Aspergillus steynii IBT 23096]